MLNKKSVIFVVAMVFFLMVGAVSAQDGTNTTVSVVSATVEDNLEQSLDVSSGGG